MTPSQSTGALDRVRAQVAPSLGEELALRLRTFRDGGLYIDAPWGRAFLAWLIDVALVVACAVSAGVAASTTPGPNAAEGAVGVIVILLVVLPLLYGWFFQDGRALGGLLTGTRLVRIADGSRIGFWKAGWAMLIRTLFVPVLVWSMLQLAGASFSTVRTSIDDVATRRLRDAGFLRLE